MTLNTVAEYAQSTIIEFNFTIEVWLLPARLIYSTEISCIETGFNKASRKQSFHVQIASTILAILVLDIKSFYLYTVGN